LCTQAKLQHPNNILALAIILAAGYIGAKLLRKIHFPAVTGYMLVGIVIGPQLLNIVPDTIMHLSQYVSEFVLGVIAFSLGSNFTLKDIRRAGKAVFSISVLEAAGAWICVTVATIVYFALRKLPFHPAFVLGAAAAATAPAATVMVIREYRARGVVTDMLLRTVAIDDAWCLLISALAITVASSMHKGVFTIGIVALGTLEVLFSIIVGGLLGFALRFGSRFIQNIEQLMTVIIGFIMLIVGLAQALHLSSLLTAMAAGIVVANASKNSELYFEGLRNIDSVLFLSFFVLVGANLEITLIPSIGVLGVVYIVVRVIGKYLGVRLGARIGHADTRVGKYLAWGLVPQAGVALGVALTAKTLYPHYGGIIFTTITATTVIYELIGPFCAKYGLQKAGEIG
jgi:Kef-type K+ transport system membrane component KefB